MNNPTNEALDDVQVTTYALGGFLALLNPSDDGLEESDQDKVYCLLQLLLDRLEMEVGRIPRQPAA